MIKVIMLYAKLKFLTIWIFGNLPLKSCRFLPTCSVYCTEAVSRYGFRGLTLSLKRVLRCHPFSRHPLHDPVPTILSAHPS